jgi:decaprenylphospho-beta-D-erythro-pentofuranosid-2-ulose 2-reductase
LASETAPTIVAGGPPPSRARRRGAVIIGASSGVGRALVRSFAAAGYQLAIAARDAHELEATAADARLRFDVDCLAIAADVGVSAWDVDGFVRSCTAALGQIDVVLLPLGVVLDTDIGAVPEVVEPLAAANYVGPARLAAAFGRQMAAGGAGSIIFFSSIAAAAPRMKNAAYSAAKAALEVYAKALRVSLEPAGVKVLVLSLGYVDTALSFGLPLRFPVATPEEVASYVLGSALGKGGKRYFPSFWWWITTILRHLPWFIYRRLSF